jgi:glycyl-tRNA synthetase beta chain
MAELLLELLSEEIPARMQKSAAETLAALVSTALEPLGPRLEIFWGPRRIALAGTLADRVAATDRVERGPRVSAPQAALAGFLRKHDATQDQLSEEGDYWALRLATPARPAAASIAEAMPSLLWRFPWPKSMRWGEGSNFTWVRPLKRILCLLDGIVVPFDLRRGDDDGHGLASANLTEGHLFMAPKEFSVGSAQEWQEELRRRFVMVRAADRLQALAQMSQHLAPLASPDSPELVRDNELQDEVANLVEWPVPLLGRIDPDFMDLPPEVMQVSMRVNQRYFALKNADGTAAPWFAFVANINASDGGAEIISGNERVLRARFADARHFWDIDRRETLESRLGALGAMTFHQQLGTQRDRANRLERLAGIVAPYVRADPNEARRAGLLAKADLASGMVREFPELQGVMGGYYARPHETSAVADAIAVQYQHPAFAAQPVSIALAVADRLDTIVGFFGIGVKPTGSGDPFALRRAALGIIEYALLPAVPLPLRTLIEAAAEGFVKRAEPEEVYGFILERLRILLREQGERHDVVAAVLAIARRDDLSWLTRRIQDVTQTINGEHGANLMAGYRRAANILRIENAKDGPHDGPVSPELFQNEAEQNLFSRLRELQEVLPFIQDQDGASSMQLLAGLRVPLDCFFDQIRVNVPESALRFNRLRLLGSVVQSMNQVADFSKIEG